MMRRPRGFSLAELMLALVIAGFIGVALTRLLMNQARFVDLQQSMMEARAGARAGFNVMATELRTVTAGGLTKVARDTVQARVPVAFGVACGQPSGGYRAVMLFPYDSATYAAATIRGLAFQDSSGTWQFDSTAAVISGSALDCSSGVTPPITVPTGWTVIRVSPNDTRIQPGTAAYLYQRVRYTFEPSVQVPGRRALWRNVIGSITGAEELVAPFDTSTHFSFLTGNHLVVSATIPDTSSVRGIRLRLIGQSAGTPEGRSAPSAFTLQTDIVLVNRAAS